MSVIHFICFSGNNLSSMDTYSCYFGGCGIVNYLEGSITDPSVKIK